MNTLQALAAMAALAVAGCGPQPVMQAPPPPPPAATAAAPAAAPAAECNAAPAQFVVGKVLDAALAEEARTRAGAQRVRVVRPGQMVTMEFDEQRLTLQLDAGDKVIAARCG